MRTVVSYPGTGIFAQQVALAFWECNALEAFATTFVHHPQGLLAKTLSAIPDVVSRQLLTKLERRSVKLVPRSHIATFPVWELIRVLALSANAGPICVDRIWDHMSKTFDAAVAKRYVPRTEVVYTYEYTALSTIKRARQAGVATIIDLPSLDSGAFDQIQRAEKALFPELKNPADSYFENVFKARQARRAEEIHLSDVIVTNSSLTKASHVKAGAEPDKIIVVPLAAPAPIVDISLQEDAARCMEVVWASSFQIGKGAHYFLEAWRKLNAGKSAHATVYGSMALPEGAVRAVPSGLSFAGSVPQSRLFSAFETADVLVFPTLSDGFGMVVTEAFSRGLPVITTNQAGAADLVRHGVNGFVIPAGDAKAICEALQWCLENRRKLYEMRSAALETAKSWQWTDYRRYLISELEVALKKKGFDPHFDNSSTERVLL